MQQVALSLPEAFDRAVAACGRGRLIESEQLCLTILRVAANHFDALRLLAFVQLRRGRSREALSTYDRALAQRSDHAETWVGRGNLLAELGRFAAALSSYDRALALSPGLTTVFNNRGNLLQELGRIDEALADYDKVLALDPNFAVAHAAWAAALSLPRSSLSQVKPSPMT